MPKKLTTSEFINRSSILHSNKYIYNLVDYKNNKTYVYIICKEHGVFKQRPNYHLLGQGCAKCSNKNLTFEDYKNDIIKVHGDRYDYSLVDYKGSKIYVDIICKNHGTFKQIPNSHLRGRGCPICNSSKGEKKIVYHLSQMSIKFEREFIFNDCMDVDYLRFDFYLPDYNMCIEYDGRQHFEPIDVFGGLDNLNDTIKKDSIKNKYCVDNDIYLLRIPYIDYENIESILMKNHHLN